MNEFPVAKDSYVAFDGLSIKQKIIDRLNQTGIFTDQNYEGSNLAGINDAIAMSFSLLLYYLNQNAVNGQFSETNLYENINRIVKELDYKPVGHQTASVNFSLSCQNLNAGFYTIPRYSSVNVGGLSYSLSNDVSFTKVNDTINEPISGIEGETVLYQGAFTEYPIFTPAGNPNEIVYLTVDDTKIVDNFNIHVYVSTDGVWEKWEKTQSLYISDYLDKVYELRFNEKKRYELKFGDNINGKQLSSSNQVLIYYLVSDGNNGVLGAGGLESRKIGSSTSNNLTNIFNSYNVVPMTPAQMTNLSINNKFSSTYYALPESVDSIRKNAPSVFRSQFNITTKASYETFIRSNFYNIVQSVKVQNNAEYVNTYMKYFYNIGLTKPQYESRALFNQINFADSCNFNNVYIFVVPKTIINSLSYLNPSQKKLINDTIISEQVLTSETIISDPVYISFDICLNERDIITREDVAASELYVIRTPNSRRNETSIKTDIQDQIVSFFDSSNNTLGQIVNIQQLNTNLLNINGVSQIYTRNINSGNMLEGVKMSCWNPVYFSNTIAETTNIVRLEDFQFPYLNNKTFVNRITVI
jgi:hypothetical protein